MRPRLVCFAIAALALAACDATRDGRTAYREGRFADALASLQDADDGASAVIAYDRALAALQAKEWDEAESSADAAALRDDAFVPLRDFVRGNVAFARCEAAEIETFAPGAGPAPFDRAIVHAETARRHWIAAATSRADWPEARRNVERAVLASARLAARKAEAASQDNRARKPKEPRPESTAPRLPPPTAEPKTTAALLAEGELPRGEVLLLLDRLAEKERQKLDLRRAARRTQPATAEKDW